MSETRWSARSAISILAILALVGTGLGVRAVPARSQEPGLPPTNSAFDGASEPGPTENPSPIPCVGGEAVALVQDNVPWFAPSNQDPLGANVTELKAQGVRFCIINSKDVGATNLSRFQAILIAAAQTQSFYDNLFPGGIIHPALTAYVRNGGLLSANLTDCASGPGAGGTWATVGCGATSTTSFSFVGGVKHVHSFVQDNSIASSTHPVVADGLTCPSGHCGQIVDVAAFQDLDGWNLASHGYFINLPAGTQIVLTQPDVTGDGIREPVMVEYAFGAGRVVASQTTTEWRYVGGFGGLPQNRKLLANDLAYQLPGPAGAPLPVAPCRLPLAFASQRDGNQEIYVMNDNGSGQGNRTNSPGSEDGYPRWSPDGRFIAFASNRDGNWEVYVMRFDGSQQRNVTRSLADDGFMDWAPTGGWLVFASDRSGNREIYKTTLGGSPVIRLTSDPAEDVHPAWSPDGTRIAFASERDGDREIFMMKANGTGLVQLTTNTTYDDYPAWSPDRNQIVFASDRDSLDSSKLELYVLNVNAPDTVTRLTFTSADERHPAWSSDGSRIAFSSDRSGDPEIYVMNLNDPAAAPSRLTFAAGVDDHPNWCR